MKKIQLYIDDELFQKLSEIKSNSEKDSYLSISWSSFITSILRKHVKKGQVRDDRT